MNNIKQTEEDQIRSIENILERMSELAMNENNKQNNRRRKGNKTKAKNDLQNKRQVTLLKGNHQYINLHIPNVPTTFVKK